VTSFGNSGPKAMLRHELSLVRCAALYADEVQLMSAQAQLVLAKNDLLAKAEGSHIWDVLEDRPYLREKLSE
jgi:hypothetical protein